MEYTSLVNDDMFVGSPQFLQPCSGEGMSWTSSESSNSDTFARSPDASFSMLDTPYGSYEGLLARYDDDVNGALGDYHLSPAASALNGGLSPTTLPSPLLTQPSATTFFGHAHHNHLPGSHWLTVPSSLDMMHGGGGGSHMLVDYDGLPPPAAGGGGLAVLGSSDPGFPLHGYGHPMSSVSSSSGASLRSRSPSSCSSSSPSFSGSHSHGPSPKEEASAPAPALLDVKHAAVARPNVKQTTGPTGRWRHSTATASALASNGRKAASHRPRAASSGAGAGAGTGATGGSNGVGTTITTSSGGTGLSPKFVCRHAACKNKPFGRAADLDRHMKMVHLRGAQSKEYLCDYRPCGRHATPFFRQDHFRDHLREYHLEDLVKRRGARPAVDAGVAVSSNNTGSSRKTATADGSSQKCASSAPSSQSAATSAAASAPPCGSPDWWRSRSVRAVYGGWWRCGRCLVRVSIRSDGFVCGKCNTACESERQAVRGSFPAMCDWHGCSSMLVGGADNGPFYAHDEMRAHLRSYHGEDLPGPASLLMAAAGAAPAAATAPPPGTQGWWRCNTCLARVQETPDKNSWDCHRCYRTCEPERVAARTTAAVMR